MTRLTFATLMQRDHSFRRKLMRLALKLTGGNEEVAEDLVQEVALAAAEDLESIQKPEQWFNKVLNHKYVDWVRRQITARNKAPIIGVDETAADPTDAYDCCQAAKAFVAERLLPCLTPSLHRFLKCWLSHNGDMAAICTALSMRAQVARARFSEVRRIAADLRDGDARPPPLIVLIALFRVCFKTNFSRKLCFKNMETSNVKFRNLRIPILGCDVDSGHHDDHAADRRTGSPDVLLALWGICPRWDEWLDTAGDNGDDTFNDTDGGADGEVEVTTGSSPGHRQHHGRYSRCRRRGPCIFVQTRRRRPSVCATGTNSRYAVTYQDADNSPC